MSHIAIIGAVLPEPNSTAAGTRMLQLIDLFREMGWRVSFLSSATKSVYSADLESKGVEVFSIEMNHSSFDELMKKLSPKVVMYDRFLTEEQFGWRVAEVLPNALTILDTEDLHFLRKSREVAYKNGQPHEAKDCLQTPYFAREMASILRCDLSLIISDFEYHLLVEKFRISPEILHYIPMFGEKIGSQKGYSERRNFISIGNFLHEPNWQTVLLLKRYWRNIRQAIPSAEMHIYGAYTPQKAQQLHNEKEGFLIRGRAENLAKTFQEYRVLLAPIPFGAGIKGKLLDAMQLALPSVTTPIGAEGMSIEGKWNGYITENEADFVEKSVLLYGNEALWNEARERGDEVLLGRFAKAGFDKDFKEKVGFLLDNLGKHRERHYLQNVLRYHTLQSTRYMSKWIEEKGKK